VKTKRPKVKPVLVSGKAPLAQELARRLKVARTACGLSQDEVGKHFGISSRSVSQWEVAKATPKADKIKGLAELYRVPMEWLWGEGEVPEGLPTIQRMSRKRGEELRNVFISHRRADWPALQNVARGLASQEDNRDPYTGLPIEPDDFSVPILRIIERVPPGTIKSLHEASIVSKMRLLPGLFKEWNVNPEDVIFIRINEDTNEPVIRRGAYLVVDSSIRDIRGSRHFYIFNIDDQANLIRRATPENSRGKLGFLLSAGNDAVAPMIVDHERLRILGRVVAVMNPL
jgi:transcriptional regulator with XRE-family HTH domain